MKDISIDSYLSAKTTMNPNKRRNGFELFGFDFMVDEDFRVWLIEVNTNPCIGIHNKSMKHILPEMFDSLFTIVLDPLFKGEQPASNDVGNFELLYSRTRGINKRRHPDSGIYPVKALEQKRPQPKFKRRPVPKHEKKEVKIEVEEVKSKEPN
jgi:hypothetical protein